MPSYLLILAHLLTDFVFQPGKLVKWKYRSSLGVLVHVLILAGTCLILFFPYLNQLLIWEFILILTITHYIQDRLKVWYEKNYHKERSFYPFFVDQLLHVIIIIFVGRYLGQHLEYPEIGGEFLQKIYFNEQLFVYGSLLILFSYALDITMFQFRRRKNPKLKYKRDYHSMTQRVFAFAILYAILLILRGSL